MAPNGQLGHPNPSPTAAFGCQNCRDQHLKCDRSIPTCGRCRAANKTCIRGYKFRVRCGPFVRRQQWVKTPKRLEFIEDGVTDETALYNDDDDDDDDRPSEHLSPTPPFHAVIQLDQGRDGSAAPGRGSAAPPETVTKSGNAPQQSQLPPPRRSSRLTQSRVAEQAAKATLPAPHGHEYEPGLVSTESTDPLPTCLDDTEAVGALEDAEDGIQSPSDRFIFHDEALDSSDSPLMLSAELRAANPGVYLEESIFPLRDENQATLLRHFVQNIAIWLDLCEPAHQFGTLVPLRAGTCAVLLNAILALSSKHLAHVSNWTRYASDHYHQKCLNVLIPLLRHHAAAADENLFAATIILRVWEEMEFKFSGIDSQGYLLGIHAFVRGHGHRIKPNTLAAACFWVALRQEIYTATVNHQPVKADLVPALVKGARDLGPAEDHVWANRAVIHCVDVLNFCFGDEPPQNSWYELYAWNQRWKELLPGSYRPTLNLERESGDAFPKIWYHTSWHVTGIQHHILAKLFLISFDPRIPRIGGRRREAARQVDEQICQLVRNVCGIGLSNQWTPPGMFTACQAIAAFGDRFQNRDDQEAILDLLRRTDRDHARPTEVVQRQLMQSWDWAVDER